MFNNSKLKTTGILLFYANIEYNLSIYRTLLKDLTQAKEAIVKIEDLTKLYKELKIDIKFINKQLAIYYNIKYSIRLTLKKENKVYLI